MKSHLHEHRHVVVCGGLTVAFAASLRTACAAAGHYDLQDEATTPEELLNAVGATGHARPLLIVLGGRWLKDEGLELLAGARRLARHAVTLGVDCDLESLALGHALRVGLRGLADSRIEPMQLGRTLAALAAGQVWISRELLVQAVGRLVPIDPVATTDVWMNLPTLTQREKDVLLEVLEGKANKVIARKLAISEQTVKIHLQSVYRKLGVHRRVDLLKAFADSRGSTPPERRVAAV